LELTSPDEFAITTHGMVTPDGGLAINPEWDENDSGISMLLSLEAPLENNDEEDNGSSSSGCLVNTLKPGK